MSNSEQPHPPIHREPSDRKVLFSALGWVGVIAVFAVVVLIAYLPNRGAPSDQEDIQERLQIRDETEATQTRLVDNYEWINQEEGQVRIPVERAMELTLRELRDEQKDR